MFRYSLELVVFLAGAAVMILELTGSRLLAPYLGTSIFVWTSLIGIILACLSFGYWLGGRTADRFPRPSVLALMLLGAGLWMGLLSLLADRTIIFTMSALGDLRSSATVVSVFLFGVPSVLLGMVSPFAARLRIASVDRAGTTVGNLYALSTMGSILGTFLAGFVLIAYLSNPAILRLLFVLLVVTSFLASPRGLLPLRGSLVLVVGLLMVLRPAGLRASVLENLVDVNTLYSRAWIYDRDLEVDGKMLRTRFLRIGIENSGAMFLNYWGNVFDYPAFFDLGLHFKPETKKTLMIGGGSYTYPGLFLHEHPEATMDVVEIDPGVTEIAREYFFLEDNPRMRIFHEDGRVYLNRTEEQYDVIFVDAFKSYFYIPQHLVTVEAVEAMSDALVPDGALCVNLLGTLEGAGSEIIHAVYATFSEVFPRVYLFPVQFPEDGSESQNIMLVALKSADPPAFTSDTETWNELLGHRWTEEIPLDRKPLRDSFAPVEHYVSKAIPRAWEEVAGTLLGRNDLIKAKPVSNER
jgi:predicted membrane-bound spermidine synthase